MRLPYRLGERKLKENDRMKDRANREHGYKDLPKIRQIKKGKREYDNGN